jgi:hypothetical protein
VGTPPIVRCADVGSIVTPAAAGGKSSITDAK